MIADTLGIDIGTMMLIGGLIALPCAAVGVMFAGWLDARMKVEAGDVAGMNEVALPEQGLPSLGASLFPIVLPVLLISANTIISPIATAAGPASGWSMVAAWTSILGNPNMALILAGLASVMLYVPDAETHTEGAWRYH